MRGLARGSDDVNKIVPRLSGWDTMGRSPNTSSHSFQPGSQGSASDAALPNMICRSGASKLGRERRMELMPAGRTVAGRVP